MQKNFYFLDDSQRIASANGDYSFSSDIRFYAGFWTFTLCSVFKRKNFTKQLVNYPHILKILDHEKYFCKYRSFDDGCLSC